MPFVIFYPDWRILDCNEAFAALTGLSAEEAKSSSPFPHGVRPTGAESREQLKFTSYVKKKDSTVIPVTVYPSEVRDEKGDISKYYAVVEPLEACCDLPVTGTLECMADPFILVNKNGEVTFANKEALAVLKKDPGEVIGKKVIDIYRRPSYTLFYKKLTFTMNEHRPSALEDFDNRMNRWYDVRFYPCGEGMIVHFRDISLRKHQDWWLRIMTFTLDRIKEQVVLADASGRINYTNAAMLEIAGYKKDEMRVLRIFNIIESLSVERWAAAVKQAKEESVFRFDTSLLSKGGTTMPAQVEAYYLKFFNVEYICLIMNVKPHDNL